MKVFSKTEICWSADICVQEKAVLDMFTCLLSRDPRISRTCWHNFLHVSRKTKTKNKPQAFCSSITSWFFFFSGIFWLSFKFLKTFSLVYKLKKKKRFYHLSPLFVFYFWQKSSFCSNGLTMIVEIRSSVLLSCVWATERLLLFHGNIFQKLFIIFYFYYWS